MEDAGKSDASAKIKIRTIIMFRASLDFEVQKKLEFATHGLLNRSDVIRTRIRQSRSRRNGLRPPSESRRIAKPTALQRSANNKKYHLATLFELY